MSQQNQQQSGDLKPDAVDDSEPLVRKATTHQSRSGEYAEVVIVPSKWRKTGQYLVATGDVDRNPRTTADVDRAASLKRTPQAESEAIKVPRAAAIVEQPGSESSVPLGSPPPASQPETSQTSKPLVEPTRPAESITSQPSPPAETLAKPPTIATITATPTSEATNPFQPLTPNDATNPFLQKIPIVSPKPIIQYDDSKNPFVQQPPPVPSPSTSSASRNSKSPVLSPTTSNPKDKSPVASPSTSTASHSSTASNGKPVQGKVYKIEKNSHTDSYTLDIIDKATKKSRFRKVQRYSYAWGFAAALVRLDVEDQVKKDVEGDDLREEENPAVVASARRAAYQKEIQLAWYPEHYGAEPVEGGETSTVFTRVSESTVLFTYEYVFEGRRCRWTRRTISHDLVLELVPEIESSSPTISTIASSSSKRSHPLTILANLDSSGMGYFRSVGKLIFPTSDAVLWRDPEAFEATALLTVSILIDLMREVVLAAIGGSAGGVAGVKSSTAGKDLGGLVGFSLGF